MTIALHKFSGIFQVWEQFCVVSWNCDWNLQQSCTTFLKCFQTVPQLLESVFEIFHYFWEVCLKSAIFRLFGEVCLKSPAIFHNFWSVFELFRNFFFKEFLIFCKVWKWALKFGIMLTLPPTHFWHVFVMSYMKDFEQFSLTVISLWFYT